MKPSTISSKKKTTHIFFHALAIAFWIIVWEALALSIDSKLIIASPLDVAKKLATMVTDIDVYKSLGFSLMRISLGFLTAFVLGSILAGLASKIAAIKTLLSPITTVIKSTPVASFIILAIIWFGSSNLSIFISFLMVFPVIYLNLLKGIESAKKELSEMADIFEMSVLRRIFYVLLPQMMPFVISACSVALGLCWKSGVAAEVIGISSGSIGERLYRAKLYFETADLLAWTVVIILISTGFEKIIMLLLRRLAALPARRFADKESALKNGCAATCRKQASDRDLSKGGIVLENISKSFCGAEVIKNLSLKIETGEHISVMGHSGAGKTTLSRIICGLETPDGGTVTIDDGARISAVFQEDRLIESISAIGNIAVVGVDAEAAYELLKDFGFTDDLIFKPAKDLSGGEKRRCAIARALLFGGDIVIMDEPFKGIDRETMFSLVIPKVRELTEGKTLLLITHSEEEAKELCVREVEVKI